MEKIKVKIIDTNFAHAKYSSDFQESKYIEWDRNLNNLQPNEPLFITDNSMYYEFKINHPNKIGMLMEPRAMNSTIYDWISDVANYSNFKWVLTYDEELLKIDKKFQFYPHCMCWVLQKDQKIYNKTKLISTIASSKKQLIGHNLRHQAINVLQGKLDVFGRGYNPVDYKLNALKDYAFSLTIENSKNDNYFTEKLIDCFVTGTVPVYWGMPSIGKFFNTDGMIIFDTLEELQIIMESLTFEKYNSMLLVIEENFIRAKNYLLFEDWLFEKTNIFK